METIVEITPFASVGRLIFGDTRSATRARFTSTVSTFEKVSGANETDSFDDLGFHLYYDDNDRLEFVEAFKPADVRFRGIKFLGTELESIVSAMQAQGFNPMETDVGVNFEEVGIALTAASGIIEGVAAYRKGYYDE